MKNIKIWLINCVTYSCCYFQFAEPWLHSNLSSKLQQTFWATFNFSRWPTLRVSCITAWLTFPLFHQHGFSHITDALCHVLWFIFGLILMSRLVMPVFYFEDCPYVIMIPNIFVFLKNAQCVADSKYRTERHFLTLMDDFFPWILLKTDAVKSWYTHWAGMCVEGYQFLKCCVLFRICDNEWSPETQSHNMNANANINIGTTTIIRTLSNCKLNICS